MLKIKDNVDLKELEKFGFKPKYNEDTGKIDRYVLFGLMTIKVDGRKMLSNKKHLYRELDLEYFNAEFVDGALYDLIKTDLVEKV